MSRGPTRGPALLAALLALLCGCAALPPKPVPPALPASVPLAATPAAAGNAATAASWPERQWWRGFGDETLNALIARALANSPDIAAAAARIDAARAAIDSTVAGTRVHATVDASAAETRLSDNGLFPPEFLGFHWYSQFDAGVSASYSFDWWGKHRAELTAAIDSQRAAQAEHAAAALGLASTVAMEYYGWQSDSARRELALQNRAAAERRLQITDARVAAHIERGDSLHAAQLTDLAARERLDDLDAALQMHRIALAALLACASDELPALGTSAMPQLHGELPERASIDLIARRPEIIASRWRVELAARSVDVARSSFMPDISLRALAGLSSLDIGHLLDAGSAAPSIAAAVHLPLFDGGALRAGLAHSRSMLDVSIAQYRAALVDAARDVNTQLAERERWQRQESLRDAQLAAAAQMLREADSRADAGLSDARPALDARQQWLTLGDAQIQTHYARLGAELALIRALGGGYQMDSNP